MNRQAIDELKRRISLLDYLQSHDWRPARQLTRGRWMGLCPLHPDSRPSFLLDDNKGLFYCYLNYAQNLPLQASDRLK